MFYFCRSRNRQSFVRETQYLKPWLEKTGNIHFSSPEMHTMKQQFPKKGGCAFLIENALNIRQKTMNSVVSRRIAGKTIPKPLRQPFSHKCSTVSQATPLFAGSCLQTPHDALMTLFILESPFPASLNMQHLIVSVPNNPYMSHWHHGLPMPLRLQGGA